MAPAAGWYPDPHPRAAAGSTRRWDGARWTDECRPPDEAAGPDGEPPGPAQDSARPVVAAAPGWSRTRRALVAATSGVIGLVVLNLVFGDGRAPRVVTLASSTTPPTAMAKSTWTVRDDLAGEPALPPTAPDEPMSAGGVADGFGGTAVEVPDEGAGADSAPDARAGVPRTLAGGPTTTTSAPAPDVDATPTASSPGVASLPGAGPAATATTDGVSGSPATTVGPDGTASPQPVATLCRDGSVMAGTTFACVDNGGVARRLTDSPEDRAVFDAAPRSVADPAPPTARTGTAAPRAGASVRPPVRTTLAQTSAVVAARGARTMSLSGPVGAAVVVPADDGEFEPRSAAPVVVAPPSTIVVVAAPVAGPVSVSPGPDEPA